MIKTVFILTFLFVNTDIAECQSSNNDTLVVYALPLYTTFWMRLDYENVIQICSDSGRYSRQNMVCNNKVIHALDSFSSMVICRKVRKRITIDTRVVLLIVNNDVKSNIHFGSTQWVSINGSIYKLTKKEIQYLRGFIMI
jgi:hypothetical protein